MSSAITSSDLLTDAQYLLGHDILSVFGIIIGVLGVIGNLANILIFIVMGVKDGVAVSFLFLTFSDLCYVIVWLALQVATELWLMERKSNYAVYFDVDPYGAIIFFGNIGNLIYTNITLITSFLALVRCLCVSKPLYFRNTFTREISTLIMLVFSIISVVSYLPLLATMEIRWLPDTAANTTRLKLWLSPNREIIKRVIWGIKDTFLLPVTQVLIFVCVSVMVYYLRQVSRFRQPFLRVVLYSHKKNKEVNFKHEIPSEDHSSASNTHTHKDVKIVHEVALGKKELHVVRQVVLVSLMYLLANTTKMMITIAGLHVPAFALYGVYKNTYGVMLRLMETVQMFNSGVTFFIYFNYNSRFKSLCKKAFISVNIFLKRIVGQL